MKFHRGKNNEARQIENRLAREAFNFGRAERQLLRTPKRTVHSVSDFGSPVKGGNVIVMKLISDDITIEPLSAHVGALTQSWLKKKTSSSLTRERSITDLRITPQLANNLKGITRRATPQKASIIYHKRLAEVKMVAKKN